MPVTADAVANEGGKHAETHRQPIDRALERGRARRWRRAPFRKMSKAAAAKVGSSLVARKLMREVRSKPGMPIWREANGKNVSLAITRAGRDAIGVADEATASDPSAPKAARPSAPQGAEEWRRSAAGTTSDRRRPAPRLQAGAAGRDALARDDGASLDALIQATGWLPHTTRAALTGLRKRGYAVERVRDESKGSLYRIVEKPTAAVGA